MFQKITTFQIVKQNASTISNFSFKKKLENRYEKCCNENEIFFQNIPNTPQFFYNKILYIFTSQLFFFKIGDDIVTSSQNSNKAKITFRPSERRHVSDVKFIKHV